MSTLVNRKDGIINVLEGMEKLKNAVAATYGPKGNNVLLIDETGQHITKDGITVANTINSRNSLMNAGINLLRSNAQRVLEEVGDGTSSAVILGYELAHLVFKGAYSDEELQEAEKVILEGLEEHRLVFTPQDPYVENVALTTSNRRFDIARHVTDLYKDLGGHAIVKVEKSNNSVTSINVQRGYSLDVGYASVGFVNNEAKSTCDYEDGYVIVINSKLEKFNEITDLLVHLYRSLGNPERKPPVLVIAKDFDPGVVVNMVQNSKKGVPVVAVQLSELGYARDQQIEDIALYLGADIITTQAMKHSQNVEAYKFGEFKNFSSSYNHAVIFNSAGSTRAESRITHLLNLSESTANRYDKEKLLKRVGCLKGGIATIFVGGNNDSEINEKFDLYEDTVGAVSSSLKDGVLPGCGKALSAAGKYGGDLAKSISSLLQPYLPDPESVTEVYDPYNTVVTVVKSAFSLAKQINSLNLIIQNA